MKIYQELCVKQELGTKLDEIQSTDELELNFTNHMTKNMNRTCEVLKRGAVYLYSQYICFEVNFFSFYDHDIFLPSS